MNRHSTKFLLLCAFVSQIASSQTEQLADLMPGEEGSRPSSFVSFNGAVYFTANGHGAGFEMWRSDGTPGGTVLVKDINPGSSGSSPRRFTIIGDTMFFRAFDGDTGTELWKTDGTEAGTICVMDIRPGPPGSNPDRLEVLGDTLFFAAHEELGGQELWKSDGTPEGTVRVKDINAQPNDSGPGTKDSNPLSLTAAGDRLFFQANDGIHGKEHWTSDGTSEGTRMVRQVNRIPVFESLGVAGADGNRVFLTARTEDHGLELWMSDGTEAGTKMVRDINEGSSWSLNPSQSGVVLNGEYFFGADDGSGGCELWKSDGTAAGTVLVMDIYSGAESSQPLSIVLTDGGFVFYADDGVHGQELWFSDGTSDGTNLLHDILPGIGSSSPRGFTTMGEQLFFTALDPDHGRELWTTHLGTGETFMLKDTLPGPESMVEISSHGGAFQTLWFSADNGMDGEEVWVHQPAIAPLVERGKITAASNGIEAGMLYRLDAPPGHSYQWRRNGVPIAGATSRSFGRIGIEADSGVYTVEYDDGAKAPAVTVPFYLTIHPASSLPGPGSAAVVLTALFVSVAGIRVCRRRGTATVER